jgi:hypothetical protein
MKKACYIIFVSFLLVGVNIAFAAENAVDKGSFLLAGASGASFASASGDLWENEEGDGQTMFSFHPTAMYFFMPNFAVGATVGFQNLSQGDDSITEMMFGPKVAYFFTLTDSNIHPFLAASGGYYSRTLDESGDECTLDGFQFSGMGGAVFMLGDHVGLTGEVVVTHSSLAWEDEDSESGMSFGVRVGVLGFIFSE